MFCYNKNRIVHETVLNHGHIGPRLTDANALVAASTRIKMLERIWGADPTFLEAHGDQYYKILHKQRLLRIKELVALGHAEEARSEILVTGSVPISYRILASMPVAILHILLSARRLYKQAFFRSCHE